MKKIVAVFVLFLFLAGCSNDNKITLNNLSEGPIYFNYRAKHYIIDINGTKTIEEIPNGVYTYATTYGIPSSATSATVSGNAASGSVTFEKENTQILLIYSATIFNGAYTLGATMTSSGSGGVTSPTSP
jgi:methyltransferase-like protein